MHNATSQCYRVTQPSAIFFATGKKGVELQIASHGKSITRIVPESNDVEEAQQRLLQLRGTMITGDIIEPVYDVKWGADADNL